MRQTVVLILVIATLACALSSTKSRPEVNLTWSPVPDEDVVGYNVYRSEEPGRGYECVNPDPVAEPKYTDTAVKRGKTYYYRVTAVNTAGVESEPSEERSKVVD